VFTFFDNSDLTWAHLPMPEPDETWLRPVRCSHKPNGGQPVIVPSCHAMKGLRSLPFQRRGVPRLPPEGFTAFDSDRLKINIICTAATKWRQKYRHSLPARILV
jgi:hypothetical protein